MTTKERNGLWPYYCGRCRTIYFRTPQELDVHAEPLLCAVHKVLVEEHT